MTNGGYGLLAPRPYPYWEALAWSSMVKRGLTARRMTTLPQRQYVLRPAAGQSALGILTLHLAFAARAPQAERVWLPLRIVQRRSRKQRQQKGPLG